MGNSFSSGRFSSHEQRIHLVSSGILRKKELFVIRLMISLSSSGTFFPHEGKITCNLLSLGKLGMGIGFFIISNTPRWNIIGS